MQSHNYSTASLNVEEHYTPYYNQIRRLPDSADRSTGKQDWQYHHKELRSIQFTITRRSRASAQNTVCANQNTQGTNQAELRQRHSTGTSTHALDSSTQRRHHEQICDPLQWMHELLQQIEPRATPLREFGETVQNML